MALKIYNLQLNLYNDEFFSGIKILLNKEEQKDTNLDNKVYIYTFNSDTQYDNNTNKNDIITTITNQKIIFPVSKTNYRDIYFNKDILNKINASKLLKNFNQVESDKKLVVERLDATKYYLNDYIKKNLSEDFYQNYQSIKTKINIKNKTVETEQTDDSKSIAVLKSLLNELFNLVKTNDTLLKDLNNHIFNTQPQEYFNMFLKTTNEQENVEKIIRNKFIENIFVPIFENKNIERYSNSTVRNYNDDSTLQNIISKNLEFVCDNPKSNKDNDKYNAVLYYNIFNILNLYYITSDSIFLYKKRIFTVKNIESIKYNNNNFSLNNDNTITISLKINFKNEIPKEPSLQIKYKLIDLDESEEEKNKILAQHFSYELKPENFNKDFKKYNTIYIDTSEKYNNHYTDSLFKNITKKANLNIDDPIEFFFNKDYFLIYNNNTTKQKQNEYNKKMKLNEKFKIQRLQNPYKIIPDSNIEKLLTEIQYESNNIPIPSIQEQNKDKHEDEEEKYINLNSYKDWYNNNDIFNTIRDIITKFILKPNRVIYIDDKIYQVETIFPNIKSIQYQNGANIQNYQKEAIVEIAQTNKIVILELKDKNKNFILTNHKELIPLIGNIYLALIIIEATKIDKDDIDVKGQTKRTFKRLLGIEKTKKSCTNRLNFLDFNFDPIYGFLNIPKKYLVRNFTRKKNKTTNNDYYNKDKENNIIRDDTNGGKKNTKKYKKTRTRKFKKLKKLKKLK